MCRNRFDPHLLHCEVPLLWMWGEMVKLTAGCLSDVKKARAEAGISFGDLVGINRRLNLSDESILLLEHNIHCSSDIAHTYIHTNSLIVQ
jgi:hypothetical protein